MNSVRKALAILRENRGISLLETVILAAFVGVALYQFARVGPALMRALVQGAQRPAAVSLASSELYQVKSQAYLNVARTPAASFLNTSVCDCEKANWSVIPSTGRTVGNNEYRTQVCVNSLTAPNGDPVCPSATDTGLKNIMVRTTWGGSTNLHAYTARALLTDSATPVTPSVVSGPTGTFRIRVCRSNTASCNSAPLLASPSVAVYKTGALVDNRASLGTNPIDLVVPAGSGYSVHVQKQGHFIFHLDNQMVSAGGTTSLDATLKNITDQDVDTVGGEVFVTEGPTISKVISQMYAHTTLSNTGTPSATPCPNYSELLEIYNGTSKTLRMGCGSGPDCIQVQYCDNASCSVGVNSLFDGTQGGIYNPGLATPKAIGPGKYFYIAGISTSAVAATQWSGVAPDLMYDVSATNLRGQRGDGLITRHGGGIKLYVGGVLVDTVRWIGVGDSADDIDGMGHWITAGPMIAAPGAGLGPWTDNNPLSQGKLKPGICQD